MILFRRRQGDGGEERTWIVAGCGSFRFSYFCGSEAASLVRAPLRFSFFLDDFQSTATTELG